MPLTAPPAATTPAAVPVEGPAGKPVSYPDGLTMRLTAVTRLDPKLGSDVPAGATLVKATVAFTNRSAQPIPLESMNRYITIFHGPNRMEAGQVTGYDDPDPAGRLSSDDPTRIAPGKTVTVFRSAAVPTDALDELVVEVEAPQPPGSTGVREPYTFLDADKLLR